MLLAKATLAAILLALPLAVSSAVHVGPEIIIWSWQHNDDLSQIDPAKVGVCYFVGQLNVDGEKISFDRNMCRVQLPATTNTPVYRETAVRLSMRNLPVDKFDQLAERLSEEIVVIALSGPKKISTLQIDFDARVSDRKFYSVLLKKVKSKLPSSVKLSMTALASWCLGDNWISSANLPVDEVVPMLFTMGAGHSQAVDKLKDQTNLPPDQFGGKVAPGLSIGEPDTFALLGDRLPNYKRIYLFSSRGWNRKNYGAALQLVRQK